QSQPATLTIFSGNNQSGTAGAQLAQPLIARVVDASGNPLPNVAVVWQSLNLQSVTLTTAATTSDANGLVSAMGTLGLSAGLAQPSFFLTEEWRSPIRTVARRFPYKRDRPRESPL